MFLLIVFIGSVSSWEFNGTVYGPDGNTLENATVNLTYYTEGPQGESVVGYSNATTNSSGVFSLEATQNDSYMYTPVVRYTNQTTNSVQYVGQSLPQFPCMEFCNMTGLDFRLQEAGTINVTTVHSNGTRKRFGYQIKDTKLGYDIAQDMEANVTEKVFYVPKNRNYSILVNPSESFPLTYEWTNFSSNNNYTFDNESSSYNDTTNTLHKQFNATERIIRITGYLNESYNWTDFTIVPFILEGGNTIFLSGGSLSVPYNLSAWGDPSSDRTDKYNMSSGFYNISLIAPVEGAEYILFASAKDNESNYYGSYRNLTLNYGDSATEFNFSQVTPLMADNWNTQEGNFMMSNAGGNFQGGSDADGDTNISSAQQKFRLVNSSNNSDVLEGVFAHVEMTLDYSSYGCDEEFTFIGDMDAMGDAGEGLAEASVVFPLLNASVKEMNIYSQNYAPKRIGTRSASAVASYSNISMSEFNPGDINGELGKTDVSVTIYKSNSTCNEPGNQSGCVLQDSSNLDNFNPLKSVLGGGNLIFEMGTSDVLIRYINVDLLASGPPSGLFEDNDKVEENTEDSFSKAMRFGSDGPTIYDYVIVGVPYTEGNSTQSGLNESAEVNVSIPYLYGEGDNGELNWSEPIWNTTENGTSGNNLAGNYSHYEQDSDDWEDLMGNNTCITNASNFNSTNPCYIDNSSNKLWVRIPHFSGNEIETSGEDIDDVTSPNITDISVSDNSSSSSSGTFNVSITTNEATTCWYHTSAFNTSNLTGNENPTGGNNSVISWFTKDYSSDGTKGPYYVSCRDTAGNNMTSSNSTGNISVSVTESSGNNDDSSSGGSSTTTTTSSFWTSTDEVTGEEFEQGYTKERGEGERFEVDVDDEEHHIGVVNITGEGENASVVINVSSETQQATLSVGDIKKFDVTDDDYYDFSVELINITEDEEANLTIQKINQEISINEGNQTIETTSNETGSEEGEETEDKNLLWLWILLALIVIGILSWVVYVYFVKNNERNKK